MQPPRDETLRTLLGDLYPIDSSGDGKELSSQLLQILSQSSGDGDMAEHIDPWSGGDVVCYRRKKVRSGDSRKGGPGPIGPFVFT